MAELAGHKRLCFDKRQPLGVKNRDKMEKMIAAHYTDADMALFFYKLDEFGSIELERRLTNNITVVRNRIFGNKDFSQRNASHMSGGAKRSFNVRETKETGTTDITSRTLELFGNRAELEEKIIDLSNEDLVFYRDHPVEFAKDYVLWDDRPLIIHESIAPLLTTKERFIIINKSARIGWSMTAVSYRAFHKSIFYPNNTTMFVSINDKRARDLIDYVYAFAGGNKKLFGNILVKQAADECSMKNGSKIYSLPNSPSGVRGIPQVTGIDVYLDEFAHYTTPADEKMWAALVRNMAVGGGDFRIGSTPFGRRGKFYEIWSDGDKPPHEQVHSNFKRFEIPWWDSWLSKDAIEEIKQTTDPISFKQEFCCDFISAGQLLFNFDLVNSCVNDKLENETEGDMSKLYYMGVDFAAKHDETVAIVVEKKEKKYVVRKMDGMTTSALNWVRPHIYNVYNKFRPTAIYCDETGLGIPLVNDLQQRLSEMIVQGVPFSNVVKEKLIMNLYNLFDGGMIEIPNDEELKTQLIALQRDETEGGRPKYSGKSSGRDDRVWALALAVQNPIQLGERISMSWG